MRARSYSVIAAPVLGSGTCDGTLARLVCAVSGAAQFHPFATAAAVREPAAGCRPAVTPARATAGSRRARTASDRGTACRSPVTAPSRLRTAGAGPERPRLPFSRHPLPVPHLLDGWINRREDVCLSKPEEAQ
ncbi:hypothetical protein GCM10018987_02170 [Streptomyces cremeus]